MISPQLYDLYEWDFQETLTTMTINLTHPSQLDPNLLKISIIEGISFHISYDNEDVPVLSGNLVDSVIECSQEISDWGTSVVLTKSKPDQWGFPICEPHSTYKSIDPKSALTIYLQNVECGQNSSTNFQYLEISCNAGYLPAIHIMVNDLVLEKGHEQTIIDYLSVAAHKYNDPAACLHLGIIFMDCYSEQAFQLFEQAVQCGETKARTFQGILMSPVSGYDFPNKNAAEAIKIFRNAIETDESDFEALYHYAEMLNTGTGCDKNEDLAQQFLEKSLKISKPGVLPKTLPKAGLSTGTKVGIAAATVIAIAGIGFTIYRLTRHKSRH